MSEVTYLLFTLVTIYLLSVIDLSKKIYANGTFYFLVLSLAIAFYVRSQGVSLLFAALVFFLANRKWAYAAASCILPVCLFLPWYFRGKSLGGNSYVSQFLSKNPYQPELGQMSVSDLVTRFFHNVERYIIVEIPNGVLQMSRQYADNYSGTQWLGSLLIIALIIYGLSKIQTKFRLMLLALMAGTFGIAFLWPEQWYGTRFMFNVIPVLLMLFLFGIYHLISLLLNKAGTANFSPYFLLAILLFFMKGVNQLHDYREEEYNPAYANLFKIAEWANQHTPEASLFCCRKPEMFYFFSDRKCANYKYGKEEEVIKDLEDNHINYVVVEQLGYGSTGKYLVPAIRKYPNRFKLLKTLPYPDTYLFEFIALR